MPPSTPRPSARLLLLLASTILAPGALAQAARPSEPAAVSAPGAKPDTPAPGAETKPGAPVKSAEKPGGSEKPAAAEAKTPGTAATVVNLRTIEGIMGKSVRSRSGNEDMGHIVDVLVDGAGQLRAAVIDFGGFLGVGSRKVAVAWKTLDFADSIQSGSVKVSLTRDQVRQAPEYKPDEPIVVLEGAAPAKETLPPAKDTAPAAKPAAPPPPAGHIQDSPAR